MALFPGKVKALLAKASDVTDGPKSLPNLQNRPNCSIPRPVNPMNELKHMTMWGPAFPPRCNQPHCFGKDAEPCSPALPANSALPRCLFFPWVFPHGPKVEKIPKRKGSAGYRPFPRRPGMIPVKFALAVMIVENIPSLACRNYVIGSGIPPCVPDPLAATREHGSGVPTSISISGTHADRHFQPPPSASPARVMFPPLVPSTRFSAHPCRSHPLSGPSKNNKPWQLLDSAKHSERVIYQSYLETHQKFIHIN